MMYGYVCEICARSSYILKIVPSFIKGEGKCNVHKVSVTLESGQSNQIHWANLPGKFTQCACLSGSLG